MKFGFIDKLGGVQAVYDMLAKADYKLSSVRVIYLWSDRKKVPTAVQLILMKEAGKRGIALGYDDFEYGKEKKDERSKNN